MFRFMEWHGARAIGGGAASFIAIAFALFTFSAEAANITFVATNGNDANPCTVITAPCKTLQRAYTVTPINGTINVLTSLDAATLAINKNITVVGNGVAIVGSIVIGTSSTNAVVTLRGLSLNGAKIYNNGIRIDAAAAVHIEDCTTERYNSDGIRLYTFTTAIELFVSNTVSRDNGGNGLLVSDDDAHVTIDNSHFENNASAGLQLWVANANVTETIAADNTSHGYFIVAGSFATLTSSVARGNGASGLLVADDPSPASAVISGSVFTNNAIGIDNRGTLYTYANNTNVSNGDDYFDSGGAGVKITVSPGF